jgi:N-acetylmuramoyl-L-alanine amidase
MSTIHHIKQGETCAHVAARYGIPESTIWRDPANEQLARLRKNPNVLFPGDELTVPEVKRRELAGATEQRHRFRRPGVPLKLRLSLKDVGGEARSDVPCEFVIADQPVSKTSDGDGLVEVEIPIDAETVELVLDGRRIELAIGHLDPVTEVSGWRERLNNLGYNAGDCDDEECRRRDYALEEFQCDHGLTVDGICGPKTQAKLVEVHGC